ncbi:(2Fe-2S)-binding protein [bacterium]|nr:MAG: (2Fe-2S)-binding protein [bacterium]
MRQDSTQNPEGAPEENSSTRRTFLKGVGLAGVAASLGPFSTAEAALRDHVGPAASNVPTDVSKVEEPMETQTSRVVAGAATTVAATLKVNGQARRVAIDPRASLLDTLRETVHLTGTKKGCDHGQCGACTVHIDGKRALSCLTLALSAQGREITTIEGLGTPEKMHPMQAAFVKHDGYQCGYCTSGQIMSATALSGEGIGASDAEVKEAMSGNICRCGAYANIVDAIQEARRS